MNSLLAILFVMAMTVLAKWLLFDKDSPGTNADDSHTLRIVEPPPANQPTKWSKSA